jgi:signal peptidase I
VFLTALGPPRLIRRLFSAGSALDDMQGTRKSAGGGGAEAGAVRASGTPGKAPAAKAAAEKKAPAAAKAGATRSGAAKAGGAKTGAAAPKGGSKDGSAGKGGILELGKTIVYAGLIAIGIRTFLFEPFNIPSGSMIPTLLVGDFLFVSKYSYGYSRYSFPFAPDLFQGRILGSVPHRGDVVVFRNTRDTSQDWVKRVIGLPGDRVQVKAGQLYLNGTEVPREPRGDYVAVDERGSRELDKRYQEVLPNGVKHSVLKRTDEAGFDGFNQLDPNNTPEYVVPAGHLFMMGDNRDNSADSRFMLNGLGFVPIENVVGRAQIIFFSFDAESPWWQFWQWPLEVRWGRLLRPVR